MGSIVWPYLEIDCDRQLQCLQIFLLLEFGVHAHFTSLNDFCFRHVCLKRVSLKYASEKRLLVVVLCQQQLVEYHLLQLRLLQLVLLWRA